MAEPNPMYSQTAIFMLRANLGYFNSETPPDLDAYLLHLLEKAFADFSELNVHLKPGVLSDDFDQATYAAWLYRNGPTGAGKTEALKSIIRNRQLGQALNTTEAGA